MKIKFSSNLLPFSILCRLYTWSPASHCELVFSDGMSIYPAMENGHIIMTRTNYRNETHFDLDITKHEEDIIRKWAYSQIGKPYDYTALAPFNVLIPRTKKNWKDNKQWMCSEFCAYGLDLIDITLFSDKFKKIKPSDLLNQVRRCSIATEVPRPSKEQLCIQ
jgi:hypothetical protein